MISMQRYDDAVAPPSAMLQKAGIVITPEECKRFEVADFGLGELDKTGLEIITYVNTERCCAKEIVMFPRQTCPEHWHPAIDGVSGKEETFRCRWGTAYLYVPGPSTRNAACKPPQGSAAHYCVAHQIVLTPRGSIYDHAGPFELSSIGPLIPEFCDTG